MVISQAIRLGVVIQIDAGQCIDLSPRQRRRQSGDRLGKHPGVLR